VVVGGWLDLIREVFSNLNDSMILKKHGVEEGKQKDVGRAKDCVIGCVLFCYLHL